jgi:fatty-acyl-CoA synthase
MGGERSSYPLLLKQLLHSPRLCSLDKEIVYRDLRRYTYREFLERLNRLANGLTSLGMTMGDTVAVMDWDSHRYLECYFAVPMMGAVLLTVNVRYSAEQILYAINCAEPDILLINSDFFAVYEEIRPRIETVKTVVILTDDVSLPPVPFAFEAEYESLLAGSPSTFAFPTFDENTRATTFFTSGTTGLPKGVYFTHRQLVLQTLAETAFLGTSADRLRISRNDVYMPITPMFHVHAWCYPYVATMLGLKQVYPGRYSPEMLLTLLASERVTFSHCVPTILHMLLSSPMAKDIDFSGWKALIGGTRLGRALCKSAMERGIEVWSGYGMSETCPTLALVDLTPDMLAGDVEDQAGPRCMSGLPLPLVDLRIVDEDMNDVAHDGVEVGEVVVRAPWLTAGYLKDEPASDQLWRGGYLHTGDVASLNNHGCLQITDRIKDLVKTGGEWVACLDVEDAISRHPAVQEVAVIGLPHERWGERPAAIVVIHEEERGRVSAEDIREFVLAHAERGMLPRYAVPDQVFFCEALARTSVGKVNKRQLREQYGA